MLETLFAPGPLARALDPKVTGHLAGELSTLAVATHYRDWLYDRARPHLGTAVLEVGAGLGYMTDCIVNRRRVVALELVHEYAEVLRGRFAANPSVEVLEADATDSSLDSLVTDVDSAMSFNVLEHIEDDEAVLRAVRRILPEGGRFVCFVPAFPSLYGRMDVEVGHVRRYRRRDLVARAERAGWHVLSARYMNLPGYFAWFLNGRVLRSGGAAGGERAVRLYDRTMVPVARWTEDRFGAPFGQSLLAILERPAG